LSKKSNLVELKQIIMKKLMITVGLGVCTLFANSQALTNKKGQAMLPASGDWGISAQANPFIDFASTIALGMFGAEGTAAAPSFSNYYENQTFIGKRFKSDNQAERVIFNIGLSRDGQTASIQKDSAYVTGALLSYEKEKVEDKWASKSLRVGLGYGLEWRRGSNRLQGYYGADAMLWVSSSSNKYTYGNDANESFSSTDFNGNVTGESRTLSSKSGMTFGLGVRGFVGVEYFFLPKMSLGAEYGYGLGLARTGQSSSEVETWNSSNSTVSKEEIESGSKSSSISLDFDNVGGNPMSNVFGAGSATLRLAMYF
jgi:hypothetical protein